MLRTREGAAPAAESDISKIEDQFGFILPDRYHEFLMNTNGGRPDRDLVAVPGCAGSPVARVHFFFGINYPLDCYDLAWNIRESTNLPADLIPIAATEGADIFCLTSNGSVVFWDAYECSVFPVAQSFDEFLKKLYRDDLSPIS